MYASPIIIESMSTSIINICIYEDNIAEQLFPLTTLKPAYDLLIGMDSIFDKVERYFNYGNITLHCRAALKNTVKERHLDTQVNTINTGTPCLFINGRLVLSEELFTLFSDIDAQHSYLFTHKGQVLACYLRGNLLSIMKDECAGIPRSSTLIKKFRDHCITKEIEHAHILTHTWDIININSDTIISDFNYQNKLGIIKGNLKPFVSLYNENNIYIGEHTTIEDFVVINAENGPVYIEENVYIETNTRLEGPLFIGKNSQVLGGKLKESSIGAHCKISGEINHCVIQHYSNKAHQGYLGHSYIGEWVNLGAETTSSNLKSNYSSISIIQNGEKVDTKQLFLGSIIGDFVKTSIGTTLNTGSTIHIGSTLFNAGFHDKYIPPFSWGSPQNYECHAINKLLETSELMMKRRDIPFTDNAKKLLIHTFNNHAS
jgi:UDP-N-acetylglucosamine diphosphorylase / glucose-1-phosphate thymidylyltransferase / UDP-N-acetylgalactosamine diphosphorylase / glucosamine-1-phosphate N-acetyltransferase / galactosamine-1-phosphate N-acetyltransferase